MTFERRKRKTFTRKLGEVKLVSPFKRRCWKLRVNPAQETAPESSTCHFYSNHSSSAPVKIEVESDEEIVPDNANGNLPTQNETQLLSGPAEMADLNPDTGAQSGGPVVERLTINDFESHVNGHCFVTAADGEVSLLVSFLPTSSLILRGCAVVETLLGNVSVLDHLVKEGDSVPIFAPEQYPSVIIQGSYSKSNILGTKKLQEKFLPFNEGTDEDSHEETEEGGNKTEAASCVVSETFIEKIKATYLHRHGPSAAETKLESLNLSVGEQITVVRVRDFPLRLLERTLHKLYPESVKSDHLTPVVYACTAHGGRDYNALSLRSAQIESVEASSLALPVFIPSSWQKITRQLKRSASCRRGAGASPIRVVVVGLPRSGKKTFTRYLINALLESQNCATTLYRDKVEASRCKYEHPASLEQRSSSGVCVLDANLVRPMQCFPSAVSLSRYLAPVFGPAFEYGVSHVLRNCEHANLVRGLDYTYDNMLDFSDRKLLLPQEIKAVLIGKSDLLLMKYEFMDAMKSLCKTIDNECVDEPLIFSFPSISEDYERGRFAELMDIIKPTHVVHLTAHSHFLQADMSTRMSSKVSLDCDSIDRVARQFNIFEDRICSPKESGVNSYGYNYWLGIDPHELHEVCYDYAGIPSVRGTFYKKSCPPSNIEQEIIIASYFSALWPYYALTLDSRTVMNPYITPYEEIAIEVKFGNVALQDVVPTLEMRGMVALCSVDGKYIRDTVPGCPKKIVHQLSSLVNDEKWSSRSPVSTTRYTLHGWAAVQRVDFARKWIFLLVPRCFCALLDDTVNALVLPHVTLPLNFDKLFYDDHLGNYRSIVPRGPWNYLLAERVKKIQ
ncbi:hypothetical protein FHG87_016373 [Trinorchestia longiramus]|nr:hypothetical protein FHG87_016373 [Trinorchestia longiramus]